METHRPSWLEKNAHGIWHQPTDRSQAVHNQNLLNAMNVAK